jgi:hypothetical protein
LLSDKFEISYIIPNYFDTYTVPRIGNIFNLEFLQDSQQMSVFINNSSVFVKASPFSPMKFKFGVSGNPYLEPSYTATFVSDFSVSTPDAPPICGVAAPCTGGVPEPANWALLIAGFGLTGAAMRRRRVAAA